MTDKNGAVRWEWGKALHDLRPYYAERLGLGRVGPLAAPPDPPTGYSRYGLDASGRLMVSERYTSATAVDKAQYSYFADRIEVSHRHASPEAKDTKSTYRLDEDGRVLSWQWDTMRGPSTEKYQYEAGRLTRVTSRGSADDADTVYRLTYEGDTLVRITSQAGRGKEVEVYELPRADDSKDDSVESRLGDAIIQLVAGLDLEEPAYGLLLVDAEGLPPEIGIGLERERARLVDTKKNVAETLWSPEDLELFDDDRLCIEDEALLTACKKAEKKFAKKKDGARSVFVALARRFNDNPSLLRLPKTEDFVTLVVGLDYGVRADAADYVGKKKLETLVTKGLVPRTALPKAVAKSRAKNTK